MNSMAERAFASPVGAGGVCVCQAMVAHLVFLFSFLCGAAINFFSLVLPRLPQSDYAFYISIFHLPFLKLVFACLTGICHHLEEGIPMCKRLLPGFKWSVRSINLPPKTNKKGLLSIAFIVMMFTLLFSGNTLNLCWWGALSNFCILDTNHLSKTISILHFPFFVIYAINTEPWDPSLVWPLASISESGDGFRRVDDLRISMSCISPPA